jgi:hypothetical protein
MTDIARSSYQGFSHELIARLVNAGYLQPALRNDANAIARAIAKMKEDLRGRAVDDDGRKWSDLDRGSITFDVEPPRLKPRQQHEEIAQATVAARNFKLDHLNGCTKRDLSNED